MNINQVREQLKIDEGVKYEVYDDHLGYKTFGIGHLVTANDGEYGAAMAILFLRKELTQYLIKM
jgi:GH24 family phage-related lysozyme (muramidase)